MGTHVKHTPEEREKVMELYGKHHSISQISKAVGRSYYLVSKIIQEETGGIDAQKKDQRSRDYFSWDDYEFKSVI